MIFNFKQATESDREYLLALRQATMVEHLERAGQFLTEKAHSDRVDYEYENSHLVYQKEDLVGAVKYRVTSSYIDLIQVQIDPKFQGRGYGSGVVKQILSHEKGKMMRLTVLKENPALALYKRLGFQTVGEDEYEYHMLYTH
jgi:ribosomal protein S18 acetylase RimI-like enzyme